MNVQGTLALALGATLASWIAWRSYRNKRERHARISRRDDLVREYDRLHGRLGHFRQCLNEEPESAEIERLCIELNRIPRTRFFPLPRGSIPEVLPEAEVLALARTVDAAIPRWRDAELRSAPKREANQRALEQARAKREWREEQAREKRQQELSRAQRLLTIERRLAAVEVAVGPDQAKRARALLSEARDGMESSLATAEAIILGLEDGVRQKIEGERPVIIEAPPPPPPAKPDVIVINSPPPTQPTARLSREPEECRGCDGTSRRSGNRFNPDGSCRACGGQGSVMVAQPPWQCRACDGTSRHEGSPFHEKGTCRQCKGTGWAHSSALP